MCWEVFGLLYENNRGLSKISLSKIEMTNINNDFYSRDVEDIRPFLSQRQTEIEEINSFIIDSHEGIEEQEMDDSEGNEVKNRIRKDSPTSR